MIEPKTNIWTREREAFESVEEKKRTKQGISDTNYNNNDDIHKDNHVGKQVKKTSIKKESKWKN
jgi:hypothetical protein